MPVDARVLVPREADEAQLAGLPRRDQRLDAAALGERALGIVVADDLVDLHQVDPLRLQPLERLVELLARRLRGAAVELGHEERLLAISVAERLAHATLALAVVVVPAVVEEVHAVVERAPDDADGLLLAGDAEVVSAHAEDGDPRAGLAQLALLCASV